MTNNINLSLYKNLCFKYQINLTNVPYFIFPIIDTRMHNFLVYLSLSIIQSSLKQKINFLFSSNSHMACCFCAQISYEQLRIVCVFGLLIAK